MARPSLNQSNEVWRDVKYITLMPLKDSGKWLLTFTPCGHHQRSRKKVVRARCLQCEAQAQSKGGKTHEASIS